MLHHLSRAPQLEQNDCPFAQSKGFPRRRPIRPGLMFSCNTRTKGVTKRPVAKSALRGESCILRYPYARNDSQRVILQRPLPDLRLILKARSPHRWSGSPAWPWDVDGPNGQRKRYLPIHRNQTGPALAEESALARGRFAPPASQLRMTTQLITNLASASTANNAGCRFGSQ